MNKKVYKRKCLFCKKEFIPKNSGQTVCSKYCSFEMDKIENKRMYEERFRILKEGSKKERLEFIRKEKEQMRELKEKTINWKEKLQDEINKIARLIDFGLPCLARQKFGQIHGGHVFSVGSNQTIRFNLHNIHRQNAQSNHFQNDDGLLREGVVREYGQKYFDFISELRKTTAIHYVNSDYEEKYKIALKISKTIPKEIKELTERIRLRNEINIQLGIYEEKYCIFICN